MWNCELDRIHVFALDLTTFITYILLRVLFKVLFMLYCMITYIKNTHTHTFNGLLSGTTQVSRYQKGKTNLNFTGARDSG